MSNAFDCLKVVVGLNLAILAIFSGLAAGLFVKDLISKLFNLLVGGDLLNGLLGLPVSS